MTIETAFYSYLTGKSSITDLVGTRIYPLVAPYTPTYPYITYTVFAEGHDHAMDGATGLVDLTMQLDIWTETVLSLSNISEAVRNALDGFRGSMGSEALSVRHCMLTDRAQFFDRDKEDSTPYYRASMDFLIWHEESLPTL